MKRIAKFFIGFSLAFGTMASAMALDAKVTAVTGKVEVQKGDAWVAVKAGDVLPKGAVVSTGFKSSADLKINDAVITLGPLTRMTVQQLAESDVMDETSLFMDSGSVSANIDRASGKRVNFKVSSPVATASVRGTEFTMRGNKVTCTKGEIAVGRPTTTHAVVSETDLTSDQIPPETPTTAGTPVTDVGGTAGDVPVFAGQATKIDTKSNDVAMPQVVLASNSRLQAGKTQSLAASEAAVSVVTAAVASSAPVATESPKAQLSTASINVSWGE